MRRDLSLAPRNEGTREVSYTPVMQYEITEIKRHFTETIQEIRKQFTLADQLILEHREAEAEYIWRGQIIFLESAFDFFMHEFTKYGLCQIFDGNWSSTEKYRHIQVDLATVARAFQTGRDSGWFLEYINAYYAKDTFVSFESVKDQLNLLGLDLNAIADRVYYDRQSTEKTKDKFKRRLNQLYTRRNLIAHQSDRRHEDAQMQSISKEVVQDFLSELTDIVNAICEEATTH